MSEHWKRWREKVPDWQAGALDEAVTELVKANSGMFGWEMSAAATIIAELRMIRAELDDLNERVSDIQVNR